MGGFGAAACVYIATYIPVYTVFVMLTVLLVLSALLLVPTTVKDVKFMLSARNEMEPDLRGHLQQQDLNTSMVGAPVDRASGSVSRSRDY